MWMRIIPRPNVLFASCGPQISYLGQRSLGFYGLNLPEVERLLVPSVPVKLSHMDLLKSDALLNWTSTISLYQPFIPTKKDKDVKHECYSGAIMFTKNECI